MKQSNIYFGILTMLLLTCTTFSVLAQLSGTWQHTETGNQIRIENKTYQNYDHIGYFAGGGTSGESFYIGEDILYLTSLGNNRYSGYLKGKVNLSQVVWIDDIWTINGNTAHSTARGNFTKVTGWIAYPDIAGTWYQNGNSNQPCAISQNGQYLAFRVSNQSSQGYFSTQRQIYASEWNAAASLSDDYNTITWSNQTWTRQPNTTPENYPNIAGTWYQNGNANQTCTIGQNGKSLSFQLGSYTSQGSFTSTREVFATEWNSRGTLSGDGNTITWNNQTWTRNPGSTPNPLSNWQGNLVPCTPDICGKYPGNQGDYITSSAQVLISSDGSVNINMTGLKNRQTGQTAGNVTFQIHHGTFGQQQWSGSVIGSLKIDANGNFNGNTGVNVDPNNIQSIVLNSGGHSQFITSTSCEYNLSGNWRSTHPGRNWNNVSGYSITHTGNQLTLSYSGDGTSATATCMGNGLSLTGWGNITATISNGGRRIDFSNGSYWIKD